MFRKKYAVYRLHFTGPFHISNNRDDYGTSLRFVSSDSMYAAITATLAKIGRAIPNNGDLRCVISALFPFYKRDNESPAVLFFPKPLTLSFPILKDGGITDTKKMKRIKWLDVAHLSKVLEGEEYISSAIIDNSIKGEYLTDEDIDGSFVVSEVLERVAVSRSFEDAKPFYVERLHFKGESGLFFLAEGDTTVIDETLPLLSSEGIGTDRNIGYGTFDFDKTELTIDLPEDVEYGLSLSTFIPENKTQLSTILSGDYVAYDFSRRGGWITTPPHLTMRKNAIYAFNPGSVFHRLSSGKGRIVDLAPKGLVDHPIWRCGKALVLPIKL